VGIVVYFKNNISRGWKMDASRSEKPVNVYQKSNIIFKQNSIGEEMYILRSGKVKLVLEDEKGEVEVTTVEQPGEFFGEMALIDASPRSATAIAEEDDTELEVLDRGDFLKMIRKYPEFALKIMHELSNRVRLGNVLYLEVIEGAMSPYCRHNCLKKTMDAFTRQAISLFTQEPGTKVARMGNWKCTVCEYVYVPEFGDPERGIPPGTPFEELPDTWVCPDCGKPKSVFQKIEP
jgi:rubredoxin/signal-transduction protein with cAMP-binding, CBS, and nucleotidyltransferase domain